MLVLALETATRAGSLALASGELHAAKRGDPARTHGERLPGEVVEFLHAHGYALSDVELFAVIAGPGSFTGLRVGMACVQGLALAGGRRVVAMPTLEALAEGWAIEHGPQQPAIVAACLDGQRGDVFFGGWRVGGGRWEIDASEPVIEPSVGRPDDLASALAALGEAITLVGDGTRYQEALARRAVQVRLAEPRLPLADAAARRAAAHPERAVLPHALRPIYIRRPDAVLAREQRNQPAPGGGDATSSADGFTIARASATDDLSAVEALQRRAFTNAWGAEAIRWELANTDVARLYVMRAPDGTIVAYCACWMIFDELHVNSLAVDADYRRRGLATRLLTEVFREAAAAGARSATLEVRRSNQPALALYARLGFQVEGVRRDYYQEPREDALILWNRRLAG